MIYAEHPTCLSEDATKLIGFAKGRSMSAKWRKAIAVKRYARAGNGRIYALVSISGAHPAKAWADVVTGTLFRLEDGLCWSSIGVLDLKSLKTVDQSEVVAWTVDAKERSKRQDWMRDEE